MIDGDDIMAVCALEMLAEKTLANNTLVSTVMSNAGLEEAIRQAGGRMLRTAVGDKNVIDEMLRGGCNFGGEQSGHLIFRDFGTTGDGLVAALQILRIMKAREQPLSRLAQCWTRFPQLVTNVKVRAKKPVAELDGVAALVAGAEQELQAQGGRLLLRYSGTEPKIRLLVEGRDPAALARWSEKICGAIQRQIGV
jgi:phosphoglucosamine mutase